MRAWGGESASPCHLATLQVEGVRNLAATHLRLSATGNLFFGANGAGKTSILEAVHFLSTGRSFRSGHSRLLLNHEAELARVVGSVSDGRGLTTLGVQRERSGVLTARVAGEAAASLSALAERLPVILLDNEGLQLIQGAPEQRRRFLDATVFHVEQSFLGTWRRYQRALRQRNAGLRHGTLDASDAAWCEELAQAGEALSAARERVLGELGDAVRATAAMLSPELSDVDVRLRRGWDAESSLATVVTQQAETDHRQGFTQAGPHRADLRLLANGRLAADVLSRGQLKVLAAALRLAQGAVIHARGRASPTYLVDDVLAEMDSEHAQRVCRCLVDTGAQVLLTTVEPNTLLQWWPAPCDVFHVEQGRVDPAPHHAPVS
jgi:DNA replication and repair protein RecF